MSTTQKIQPRKVTRYTVSVQEVIDGARCPLPIGVFPNNMGINLCSVGYISWTELEDGQLYNLEVSFLPAEKDPRS